MSELKEACGVVGAYIPDRAAANTLFYALYPIQHRGPNGCGIATSNGRDLQSHTGYGLVNQTFDEHDLSLLQGHLGIGHVLCSVNNDEPQPIMVQSQTETIAVAHNGRLTNSDELRRSILNKLATTSDAEIIAQLILLSQKESWEQRFQAVMRQLAGSYSLTVLTTDKIFGIRDPLGLKPLSVGRLEGGWVISSETCSLEHLTAIDFREIEPGEVVQIDSRGLTSFFPLGKGSQSALCTLEYTYLARPDSRLNGRSGYILRESLGAKLAEEQPAQADLVIGIPDAGTPAAIGYAAVSGIPFQLGIAKNRGVSHTQVNPDHRIRGTGIGLKFNAMPEVLDGKKVVAIDDRMVKGNVTREVTRLLKNNGASEVHWRITVPPVQHRCFYGVEIGYEDELIATGRDIEEMRQAIGADSLRFLSLESLNEVIGTSKGGCNACFTGIYPTNVTYPLL